jgi:hypothetical protein
MLMKIGTEGQFEGAVGFFGLVEELHQHAPEIFRFHFIMIFDSQSN